MDPNKLSFDLKSLMNNPGAMEGLQKMIQQNLVNDMVPKKKMTPEEEREENRRKLREAIRQKSLGRQSKDARMKEQMKVLEKSSPFASQGIENMDIKKVVNSMVSDPHQKKVLAREMEKYIEKEKEKKSSDEKK